MEIGPLDTRYSPGRRAPSGNASISHAAPRLACVKPVASVHPEPGSNSTLYNIFYINRKINTNLSLFRILIHNDLKFNKLNQRIC